MNPGDAPRRGWWAISAALTIGAIALPFALDTNPVVANELEPFASCDDLEAWQPAPELGYGRGETGAAAGDTVAARAGEEAGPAASDDLAEVPAAATGDTNVAVDGVDELDSVDRVDERRALIAAGGSLALVDLVAGTRIAATAVPFDARLTFDPDARVAWVAGSGADGGVEVSRIAVDDDSLTVEGTWTSSGWLVDARRTGDRLHVVAVDGFVPGEGGDVVVPFDKGPVQCDQVLHPVTPSGPEATLLVSLPAVGALAPVHAAEVVGSGRLVHVTATAAYLASPLWEGDGPYTSIHRFELETLAHTGSGRVHGTLLNQFSMSEHDGFLRVGLTHPGAVTAVEDGVAVEGNGAEPIPIDPGPGRPTPGPSAPAEPLNEIVVLDTEGDLDVVGRTERFGHPAETLHGIRFDGPVAYAVTFLTTDPFYVVDLSAVAAPRVVGEVELPGFSAYLHPLGGGLVAGFGPGEDGRAAMRLFDVADPTRPSVVDTEILGDDSPVAWDHHALLSLVGGRLAVPAHAWRPVEPVGCSEAKRQQLTDEALAVEVELSELYNSVDPDQSRIEELSLRLETIWSDPCLSPPMVTDTTIVVADVGGGAIDVVERVTVTAPEPGTRVLAVGDGWAVLAGARLLLVGPDGAIAADLDLS